MADQHLTKFSTKASRKQPPKQQWVLWFSCVGAGGGQDCWGASCGGRGRQPLIQALHSQGGEPKSRSFTTLLHLPLSQPGALCFHLPGSALLLVRQDWLVPQKRSWLSWSKRSMMVPYRPCCLHIEPGVSLEALSHLKARGAFKNLLMFLPCFLT